MDKICGVNPALNIYTSLHQAKEFLSPDLLIILLGPTASGKTATAVELAKRIDGEIISADSRQVYKGMDIGTGKELEAYNDIPYHLIDIRNPGDRYNVDTFKIDFFRAYDSITARQKRPILCGGTGSYIHALLQDSPYAQIPKDHVLQGELSSLSKPELIERIVQIGIPEGLKIDFDNHKRLVRALEIVLYINTHTPTLKRRRTISNYLAYGLNPDVEERRTRITKRLQDRLKLGLVEEVEGLLQNGLQHDDLMYYGLEYKYVSLYLQDRLQYDNFVHKLNVEIHRYAKRQVTYFRKMERDGINIQWV